MKPEAQHTAIVKACGWTDVHMPPGFPMLIGRPPQTLIDEGMSPRSHVPGYSIDLNAMHEAEKILTPYQKAIYGKLLQEATNGIAVGYVSSYEQELRSLAEIAHATAAQRAEAFLRTLNLWVEEMK